MDDSRSLCFVAVRRPDPNFPGDGRGPNFPGLAN